MWRGESVCVEMGGCGEGSVGCLCGEGCVQSV